MLSYESAFLVYTNSVLKKDDSVKNSMLLALGVTVAGPAAVSGEGFVFCLEDMHGGKSDVVLQQKYNNMPESERTGVIGYKRLQTSSYSITWRRFSGHGL